MPETKTIQRTCRVCGATYSFKETDVIVNNSARRHLNPQHPIAEMIQKLIGTYWTEGTSRSVKCPACGLLDGLSFIDRKGMLYKE